MESLKSREKLHRIGVVSGLALVLWLAALSVARADGTVRGFFFFSPDCGHCDKIVAEVLPALQAQYGSQLELRLFDIREPRNYAILVGLEARYKVTDSGLPEVFIGRDVLIGEEAMRTQLSGLIDKYLAGGGVDFPTQDTPVAVTTPTAAAAAPQGSAAINVAYFFKRGCRECDRVAYDLDYLRSRYPGLRVTSFDIAEKAALSEALAQRVNLPVAKRLVTPAIFVGNDALVGSDVSLPRLEALLERYKDTGAGPVWESLPTQAASAGIVERFRSFGLLTVVGAGLIDGLNPCAFATIVFFISYLTFMERSRREIILVGVAFTLGVFLTYLLVGLGALRFVQALAGIRIAGQVIYGLMAVLCLAFAGVSVYDAWQARRGKPEEMRLRLPRFLQERVHRVIRQNSSASAFVGLAAFSGLVVSLLELACTGQVYLPTILFVMGVPQLRLHAVSYLVLYNLLFITPLVGVFVVAAFGTSSGQLAMLVQKHTGTAKLLTAAVFALLGIWLLRVVL